MHKGDERSAGRVVTWQIELGRQSANIKVAAAGGVESRQEYRLLKT